MSKEEIEALNWMKDDINHLEREFKNPNFLGEYFTIRDKSFEYFKTLYNLILRLQQENEQLKEGVLSDC